MAIGVMAPVRDLDSAFSVSLLAASGVQLSDCKQQYNATLGPTGTPWNHGLQAGRS